MKFYKTRILFSIGIVLPLSISTFAINSCSKQPIALHFPNYESFLQFSKRDVIKIYHNALNGQFVNVK